MEKQQIEKKNRGQECNETQVLLLFQKHEIRLKSQQYESKIHSTNLLLYQSIAVVFSRFSLNTRTSIFFFLKYDKKLPSVSQSDLGPIFYHGNS